MNIVLKKAPFLVVLFFIPFFSLLPMLDICEQLSEQVQKDVNQITEKRIIHCDTEQSCELSCKQKKAIAGDLLEKAAEYQNRADTVAVLKLIGTYRSYGHCEVDLAAFLPGGLMLSSVASAQHLKDHLAQAIKKDDLQEVIKFFTNTRARIFQEHLILAIDQNKVDIAEILVCLGVDVHTRIYYANRETDFAECARMKGFEGLVQLIKARTAIPEDIKEEDGLIGRSLGVLSQAIARLLE